MNRRALITGAAIAPLALAAEPRRAEAQVKQDGLPAPKYTLSCNIELMFPGNMSHADRIQLIADHGYKAFSFWGYNKDLAAMEKVQQKTGLKCGSTTGNSKTGWNTGLTKTGHEAAFMEDFAYHADVAKRFGCDNLITFVGEKQKDIPWEVQYKQIIEGLKRAGDLAAKKGVYLCLEPLSSVESPQMSVLTAKDGFKIVNEVDHPHVKLDFDMYHLQLSEGNIINNIRQGLDKKWIKFIEVGDVPGRFEPGTGEMHYGNIFNVMREKGYDGFVGLEHRSSKTPQHAMDAVSKVAGF